MRLLKDEGRTRMDGGGCKMLENPSDGAAKKNGRKQELPGGRAARRANCSDGHTYRRTDGHSKLLMKIIYMYILGLTYNNRYKLF